MKPVLELYPGNGVFTHAIKKLLEVTSATCVFTHTHTPKALSCERDDDLCVACVHA